MPKHNPRAFFAKLASQKAERWHFTAHELKHPENCRRDDLFVATTFDNDVYIERDGTPTGMTVKREEASPEEMEHATMLDILRKPVYDASNLAQNDEDEQTVERRWVYTTPDGKFQGFAPKPRPGAHLADSMLEAGQSSARAFLDKLHPWPDYIMDLRQLGFGNIQKQGRVYRAELGPFYVRNVRPAKATITIDRASNGLIGFAMYSPAYGAQPLGVYHGKWEAIKPVLQAWLNTLKFDVPENESDLPDFFQWEKSWARLRSDLDKRCKKAH